MTKRRSEAEMREEQIQHEMRGCVHFTGIQNQTCRAGVNVRELVGGPEFGWAARLPCLLMDADKCEVVCEKRHLPTREEAEVEVDRERILMDKHLKCINAAHEDAKKKGFKVGLGGADSIPCPMECGGRLYYRVASVNGHMHAKCETKDCISWME